MSVGAANDGKKSIKRGFFAIITGRTFIVSTLLVLQVLLLFWGFERIGSYTHLSSSIITALMMVYILNTSSNPTVKLTWCVVIALVPVVGIPLYFFIKEDIGHRTVQKLIGRAIADTQALMPDNSDVLSELELISPDDAGVCRYLDSTAGFPVYRNTEAEYFPSGEAKFEAMLRELRRAEKFIFLEYFIVSEGEMMDAILEILRQKVTEGVEVRFMYDGSCAFSSLPYNYPEKLRAMGIDCRIFAPVRPFLSTHYNNRDHRKILVIDGRVAFTGGVNLADEYINRRRRFGHWKDAAVLLRGEAVRSFTLMFLQMWNGAGHRDTTDLDRYLPAPAEISVPAVGFVAPYGDSPMDGDRVGEMVYLQMINTARDYVYIMSPYLILDGETLTALTFAAKRGVDIRIILPHIPDKAYAFWLAKSHYRALLEAGVSIYEYTPGFIHSKVVLADGLRAVVGTVNFDYRSFYHHFECAALLCGIPAISAVESDFAETFRVSEQVTMEAVRHEKLYVRFFGAILKVVAPLM